MCYIHFQLKVDWIGPFNKPPFKDFRAEPEVGEGVINLDIKRKIKMVEINVEYTMKEYTE